LLPPRYARSRDAVRPQAREGHALRSHGGIAESRVSFILNYPMNETYAERAARGGLRNFHIFDFAINCVAT
jgi:phosphonoacetate hydrolase